MSTAARKARKRSGTQYTKTRKTPTRPWSATRPHGIGLISGPEILARILARPS